MCCISIYFILKPGDASDFQTYFDEVSESVSILTEFLKSAGAEFVNVAYMFGDGKVATGIGTDIIVSPTKIRDILRKISDILLDVENLVDFGIDVECNSPSCGD